MEELVESSPPSLPLKNTQKPMMISSSSLRSLGYYFSKIDIFIKDLDDNKIEITYKIDTGEKAKIKNRI